MRKSEIKREKSKISKKRERVGVYIGEKEIKKRKIKESHKRLKGKRV